MITTDVQLYDAILYELNKVEAPTLSLGGYNFYINKGIQEYINTRYNTYNKTQQTTDDLQELSTTTTLTSFIQVDDHYSVTLPVDYLHFLAARVTLEVSNSTSCNTGETTLVNSAKRLTSTMHSQIFNNKYLKPSFERPYYKHKLNGTLEVYIGNDSSVSLENIIIEYLKKPQEITLTQEKLQDDNLAVDLEFPDYVVNEILKRIVGLIQEHHSDARLQTYVPVNQSIPAN